MAKKIAFLLAASRWEGVNASAAVPLLSHPTGSPTGKPVRAKEGLESVELVCLEKRANSLIAAASIVTWSNRALSLHPLTQCHCQDVSQTFVSKVLFSHIQRTQMLPKPTCVFDSCFSI